MVHRLSVKDKENNLIGLQDMDEMERRVRQHDLSVVSDAKELVEE